MSILAKVRRLLTKVIRWEVGEPDAFARSRTPEEIMDEQEKRWT
jgi:hypothetical protein